MRHRKGLISGGQKLSEFGYTSFVLLSIFLCYIVYRVYWYGITNVNIYEYFTYLFGTVNFDLEKNFAWNISLWMVPQLLVLSFCSDFFESNLISNHSVLFSRTSTRKKIIVKYALLLIGRTSLWILGEIMIAFMIGYLFGVSFSCSIAQLLLEIVNIISFMIILTLLSNMLSLFINTIYAVTIVIFLEWIQLFLIKSNRAIGQFLPVSGSLQEIRKTETIRISGEVFCNMFFFMIVIIGIGAYVFSKKKDLL